MKYLRHMAVFARIVECHSISAAAAELNLSKSVVSQQLKSLEQELGVSLLNRTTRRQTLTPAGRDFYQHCLHMNQITEKAWDEARESQQLAIGSISISAPHAFIEPIIAPAIGELVAQHSKIKPTILADDMRVDLIEGDIDLSIRVGEMQSSVLKQRKLGSFRDVLCASPGYLEREEITSERLLEWSKTTTHENSLKVDYIANAWQGSSIHHHCFHKKTGEVIELSFSANRFSNSLPSVLALVKAGAGLALIPGFLFEVYEGNSQLVNVLPEYEFSATPVYSVHAFGNQPSMIVKLSIDAIKLRMESYMGNAQRIPPH